VLISELTLERILIKRSLLLCSVQSFLSFVVERFIKTPEALMKTRPCVHGVYLHSVSARKIASNRYDGDKTRQVFSANESEGVSLLSQSSAQRMAYTTFSALTVTSDDFPRLPVTCSPALIISRLPAVGASVAFSRACKCFLFPLINRSTPVEAQSTLSNWTLL